MPTVEALQDRRAIDPKTLDKLRHTILGLFANALFHDVGIRDICLHAKVSPKTVYKYFGGKEEMLFACIKQDLDALNDQSLAAAARHRDVNDQLSAFLDSWCDFYQQHMNVARIVFLTIPQAYWVGNRQFVQARVHQAARTLLTQGQAEGSIYAEIPADVLFEMIMGAAHRIMVRWLTIEPQNIESLKPQLIAGVAHLLKP